MKTNPTPCFLFRWLGLFLLFALSFGTVVRADDDQGAASLSDRELVEEASFIASAYVQKVASADKEAFAAILREIYGLRLARDVEKDLVEKAQSGLLPLPERILVVSDEVLPKMAAAYLSEEGGAILLNEDFCSTPGEVATLILHEWGHHLDALLGPGDADFDEGELLFRGILSGQPIPALSVHLSTAGLDDRAVIEFEGRSVQVECFFKKMWSGIKKAAKAVVNVAKKTVNAVANVAKKAVSVVKNAAKSVGNAVAGVAKGIASGVLHATGNSRLGDAMAKSARSSFGSSFKGLKKAGSDAIGAVAVAGDLYNSTVKELDKVVPGLGTVGDLAVSFTPLGPIKGVVKGVADVSNVIKNGGSTGAIFGAVGFAVLDAGGSAIGRAAGGIKGAKAAGAIAKGGSKAASGAGKVATKSPGFFGKAWSATKSGIGKVKNGINKIKDPTLGSWKYTKTTAWEIARGKNLVTNWPKLTKGIEWANHVKTADILIRSKDFIPGRDRSADGKLLGTGGNDWQNHFKKIEDKWNQTRLDSFAKGKPVAAAPIQNGRVVSISGRVTGSDEAGRYLGVVPRAIVEFWKDDKSYNGYTTASESGYYTINDLPAGHYNFRVKGDGYTPEDVGRGFTIPAGASWGPFTAAAPGGFIKNFILTKTPLRAPPAGTMTGHAWEEKDGKRTPMAGVKIVAKLESAGSGYEEGFTDNNGNYTFKVLPGMWKATATPIGKEQKSYGGIVTIKENSSTTADFVFTEDDEIAPPTAGAVHALVSVPAEASGPVPVVRFVNLATGKSYPGKVSPASQTRPPRSDKERWYQADSVEPLIVGRYRAEGDVEGFAKVTSATKTLAAGQTTWFDLVVFRDRDAGTPTTPPPTTPLPPITATDPPVTTPPVPKPLPKIKPELTVRTSYDGASLYGVSVKLTKKTPGPGEGNTLSLVTNDEGKAKGSLADGEGVYNIFAAAEGCKDYTGEVAVSGASYSFQIEMELFPRINITAVNSAGEPLTGVVLQLVDKTRGKSLSDTEKKKSDDFGSSAIILNDGYGDYALMASLDGYIPGAKELALRDDPASPGKILFAETITLYKDGETRPVDLTGVLVELSPGHDKAYKDGKKIPNAQISLTPAAGASLPEGLSNPLRTGTEGEFAANSVPEGTYNVSIAADGYEEFKGSLNVDFGMEPLLLSLKPRNVERDNWIRMILSEGWGNVPESRQFHQKGTAEDKTDSNVDFALGMSALQADDKENAIPAFALAVGKVSNEKWWDRASEGRIWTLMKYQDASTAVAEIRRLVTNVYHTRAETDESGNTAYTMGVAVGVMLGPWSGEVPKQEYAKLDAEVTSALKGTHLAMYEAGKKVVTGRYKDLSAIEAKAKKELADAADGKRRQLLADLEKQLQQLQTELATNASQQEAENQKFTSYRTNAESQIAGHNNRLAEITNEANTLSAEIARLQETMNAGMQAQANRRLKEFEDGLNANIAEQNAAVQRFERYSQDLGAKLQSYVDRMNAINAELTNLGPQIEKAEADAGAQMAAGGQARLAEIDNERAIIARQLAEWDGFLAGLDQMDAANQGNIATVNQELMQIGRDQTAREQQGNELNAMSPYCEECINYSEKPPQCEACAAIRDWRTSEINRLNQEISTAQARDQELRKYIAGLNGNYDQQRAQYDEAVDPLRNRDNALVNEYNEVARQMNNMAPTDNSMANSLRQRDAQLRQEYEENQTMYTNAEAGYNNESAIYTDEINTLKETENYFREQLSNISVPTEGPEKALIDEKTAKYNQISAEYGTIPQLITAVQDAYRIEGENHMKEIERLNGTGQNLTTRINDLNTRMGSLPTGGATSEGEVNPNSATLVFGNYFDYPLEQRRQELLNWVSRSSSLNVPGVAQ